MHRGPGWTDNDRPGDIHHDSGLKRRRNDYEEDGHGKRQAVEPILAAAVQLCNPQDDAAGLVGEQIDSLCKLIIREQHFQGPKIIRVLLDCAIELSHKVPAYAALTGLLNSEENAFIRQLLDTAEAELNAAFASGDRNTIRLLLRFFAALVPSNVLYSSSVLKTLDSVVQAAISISKEGSEAGREPSLWQPYADFLIHAVLMALPWGGPDLADTSSQEFQAFLQTVEQYMESRPCKLNDGLRPFFHGEDPASISDSGSASFTGQLWEAIEEMQDSGKWKVESVPEYVSQLNEAQLATSTPHTLQAFDIPLQAPCLRNTELKPQEATAAVVQAYPPRGVIRLLPAENTWGDRPKIERLVAEEYILDTIHYFNGDRITCARTIATELPLTGKLDSIVTELIFSQMLRVPSSHFKPIAYATVLADVCKLLPSVPRSMSACVRELFQRMPALDPQLRTQLAEWLAYHLSNFDFMWPWAKWSYVLDAPPHDPQRRFVVDVFSKLVRLSYYDNILSKVPDTYKEIFPAKPEAVSLEDAEETNHALQAGQANRLQLSKLEKKWARDFVSKVKQKSSCAECLDWTESSGIADELSGPAGVLRAVLAGLLIAGSKSFTHMLLGLERYDELLTALLEKAGDEGRKGAVEVAGIVWQKVPQRAAQVIDRLMAHRLVNGPDIVRWVFSWPGFLSGSDQLQNGLAWEVLYNAVNKTLARTQDAREEMQQAQASAEAAKPPPSTTTSEMKADASDAMLGVVDDREITAKAFLLEKGDDLAKAIKDQEELFLLCIQLFRDVLSGEAAAADDTDAKSAWRVYTLAQLRSFTRRYHASIAPIADSVKAMGFKGDASEGPALDAFEKGLSL